MTDRDLTAITSMRRFELHRDEDVSGVSGTGVVAEGVAFSNGGPVALRWTSEWPTSVVFHDRGTESLEAVHGHNGRTRIVWLDAEGEYVPPDEWPQEAWSVLLGEVLDRQDIETRAGHKYVLFKVPTAPEDNGSYGEGQS